MIRRTVLLSLICTFFPVAQWASASTNPITSLPHLAFKQMTCVMWAESRSTVLKPNLDDNNADGGSSGVFQIEQPTWARWAPLVNVHVPVWRASYYQQQLVAVEIWKHDGFGPWKDDGCFG